jgi:cardiolipin synthase
VAGGVRVFEYEPAVMHAKVAVFDRSWAVVGSSNLERQSLQHSYEVNLAIGGGGFPERLAELVGQDLAAATRLDPVRLAAQGWPSRLRNRLAAGLLSRL